MEMPKVVDRAPPRNGNAGIWESRFFSKENIRLIVTEITKVPTDGGYTTRR